MCLGAEGVEVDKDNLSNNHVESRIHTRINLHPDKTIWIMILKSLVGPCFVGYNKNNGEIDIYNVHTMDRTVYGIESTRK